MVGPTEHRAASDDGWRARAACRTADPEAFFPVAEAGPELERAVAAAKRICAGCPVRAECAAWAIGALPHGIAGGMSAAERDHARQAAPARRASALRSAATYDVAADARRVPTGGRGRGQVIEAGKSALAQGVARDRIAAAFGVSRRTVDRWAADQHRASADTSATAVAAAVVGGGR